MSIFSIITIVLISIYIIIYLFLIYKNGQSFKFIIWQALISIFVLAIINLTSFATNLYIPINECTVCGATMGGLPMIFCFLMLKMIFVL